MKLVRVSACAKWFLGWHWLWPVLIEAPRTLPLNDYPMHRSNRYGCPTAVANGKADIFWPDSLLDQLVITTDNPSALLQFDFRISRTALAKFLCV